MDVAFLSATANQLRHGIEMKTSYMSVLIAIYSLSLVLQIAATGLLVAVRMHEKKPDCPWYKVHR